ncbi:MAG TPA: GldM family protein [Flavisolibacter sp.]|nr:GldM family protein [Flavisolibacter sp.]
MKPINLHFNKVPKLVLISTVLLFSSIFSFGQTNVAIAPNKMNVLYIGVDNPVTIAASDGSDDKVTVSVNGGGATVSKIGSGLYNVHVANVTDQCLINVYVGGKLAGTSSFRVRSLPTPSGTVGGFQSSDMVSADAFRKQVGLGLFLKDFPFQVKYEVLGFRFSIDDGKGGVKSADCRGALFSAQARQYIEQYVAPGSKVAIDNIHVKDEAGKELTVSSLVYYIK